MSSAAESRARHYGTLLVLILAGEIIFSLPFHIPRFFRPTMLEVFQLSNTQLGDIFAVYGVVAMLAYFPGGALADRFPARSLISISLAATGLGGLYFYTVPGELGLYFLFAYWGLTSILLFWAALIKATRNWGGQLEQGLAFGVLDGGRGFVASVLATIAVWLLGEQLAITGAQQAGLESVILFYSVCTIVAALIVWFALPHNPRERSTRNVPKEGITDQPRWRRVLSERSVWLQAGVVVCAYCGYKSLDNYGVYAVEVLGMTSLEAAELNTYASYARPLAAVAAGLLADQWRASKLIVLLFACAGAAFFILGQDGLLEALHGVLLVNVLITFVAVYALRGIYFTLIEEARLDLRVTGSAVGLISVLGFTPDIFFASIMGRVLDANPGALGFQHYFQILVVISVAGMLFTLGLSRLLAANKSPA